MSTNYFSVLYTYKNHLSIEVACPHAKWIYFKVFFVKKYMTSPDKVDVSCCLTMKHTYVAHALYKHILFHLYFSGFLFWVAYF